MPFKFIKVPKDFECSLSHEIMIDPVFTADGETYEREEITEWLKTHDTCPNTNNRLEHKTLTTNRKLKSQISEFVEQNRKTFEQELIDAAKQGDFETVGIVIKLGIKVDVQDANGWTALHHAANNNHLKVVNLLLDKKCNIDQDTAVFDVAVNKQLESRCKQQLDQLYQERTTLNSQLLLFKLQQDIQKYDNLFNKLKIVRRCASSDEKKLLIKQQLFDLRLKYIEEDKKLDEYTKSLPKPTGSEWYLYQTGARTEDPKITGFRRTKDEINKQCRDLILEFAQCEEKLVIPHEGYSKSKAEVEEEKQNLYQKYLIENKEIHYYAYLHVSLPPPEDLQQKATLLENSKYNISLFEQSLEELRISIVNQAITCNIIDCNVESLKTQKFDVAPACDFILIYPSCEPKKPEDFKEIPGDSLFAYGMTGSDFYFIDKNQRSCSKINTDESKFNNLKKLLGLFSEENNRGYVDSPWKKNLSYPQKRLACFIDGLNSNLLEKITSITGHTIGTLRELIKTCLKDIDEKQALEIKQQLADVEEKILKTHRSFKHFSSFTVSQCTPLLLAAYKGNTDMVRLLLDRNANLLKLGNHQATLLHWAARSGKSTLVEFLLARGVDVYATDEKGNTTLDIARAFGYTDCVKLIENHIQEQQTLSTLEKYLQPLRQEIQSLRLQIQQMSLQPTQQAISTSSNNNNLVSNLSSHNGAGFVANIGQHTNSKLSALPEEETQSGSRIIKPKEQQQELTGEFKK